MPVNAAPEPYPLFPGKPPEYVQRLLKLEESIWCHARDSMLAVLVSAGSRGWTWPMAFSGSFPFAYLTELLLSESSLPFFLLPRLFPRGELPMADVRDTSSSLAGRGLSIPMEGPAEAHSDWATHMGPYSLQPAEPCCC